MRFQLRIFLAIIFVDLATTLNAANGIGIKFTNYYPVRRGLFSGSSKVLGKGGLLAGRLLRVFKAKTVLLKDADLIHADSRVGRLYEKAGGKARAEKDFKLTLPTNVRIVDADDDGPVKVGIVENYKVMLKYWSEPQEIENIGETTKYTIMMVKTADASTGRPVMIHYL